jgi:hypothetical protein
VTNDEGIGFSLTTVLRSRAFVAQNIKPVTFPPQATNTMKSLSGSPTSETANTSLASINRFSVPSSSTVTPVFQPASPFGARTSSTSPPEDQVAQQRRVCTIIDSALALAEEESDLRGDF